MRRRIKTGMYLKPVEFDPVPHAMAGIMVAIAIITLVVTL